MFSFKLLIVILLLKGFCGSFIIEPNPENKEIARFVKRLIEDYDEKVGDTLDVSMFRLKGFGGSRRVDDLFEEISKIVPKTTPINFPPLNMIIDDRHLRASSFFIIVSDVSNIVSKYAT